ncbi:MAG: hypothetical protein K9K66_01320 [Desulfarculaceae bacterium]|nr:hypothetical protein [Desulfarculaceae bacterium]MCF8072353.1 hypothetical protein [Desulfarculaceae bacterium]MCF8100274.1 hypothetical protein [Desulfarculaceae bacterium]MCF8116153.1 hypothetical protein [Desulfarculaceae bacterium]
MKDKKQALFFRLAHDNCLGILPRPAGRRGSMTYYFRTAIGKVLIGGAGPAVTAANSRPCKAGQGADSRRPRFFISFFPDLCFF